MANMKQNYGTQQVLAVTALQSLSNSATVGWKSAKVDNRTSTKAVDYEVFVKLTTANTAPANDKAAYIYVCPWYYDQDNTTWYSTDGGTGTLPTDGDASYTIATPNDLLLGRALNYTTQQMVMQGSFLLSSVFGNAMPDGFSIIIVNYTGANLSTGCIVDVKPITFDIA
jgi:hypothetical protein